MSEETDNQKTEGGAPISSSELVRWQRAEKLLREAMADLEWFQTEWTTKSSLSTRINRVDWTIDNIKDFLKELPPNDPDQRPGAKE